MAATTPVHMTVEETVKMDQSKSTSLESTLAGSERFISSPASKVGETSSTVSKTEESGSPVEGNDNEAHEYPTPWKLVLITIGLCLSVFCLALDNTILTTAIPVITDEFSSLDDLAWYGSSYLLCTCALTLMFGKLHTFYPVKWTFLAALLIFQLGSLICGVAPSSVALIIGRAIAGIGAAGLFSGAILIIAQSVRLRKRPVYTGALGAMFGLASVAGPLMGGAFTDHLTWRWCFYINLPIGGLTLAFIVLFFKSPSSAKQVASFREKICQMDPFGSIFFLPGIISLLLALQWGGTKYDWDNARIIALFVLSGVLCLGFAIVQSFAGDNATVPVRVYRNRNVWGASFFLFSLGASFFIFLYFLPIWFQAIKGVSATKSGIMNLPILLSSVISAMLSGGMVTTFGYYTPFMIASSILMAIGAGLLTTFDVDTGHSAWIGYQVLLGFGIGLGMQQPLIVVQAVLPLQDVPTGTAVMVFSQTLGGALFVSVGQNVFHNQLIKHLISEVPGIDAHAVVGAGATMIRQAVPEAALPAVLKAYNDAIVETFYVGVAMAVLALIGSLPIQWVSVKGKKLEVAA
ncbi:MFS general substrate transporter [Aspergillus egyptiacus]|nr:MFS general substrate transporter [Aspergillus egyptiacus]